ncbi:ATPase involved in chromosome partitioning [Synechococcus sp. PCC 7502]|uniref:ParA family protein n=1 Tax=Synechococcus sp. PCC 7502 TaxID=1173263 RepID=UPI00029FBBDA|nr:AAA family ATPase [Synechococcus sp. PCC 7502]AFY74290.1 ATPase involved in chromosome partitioning [Synechococcus sp. PCC 7502]
MYGKNSKPLLYVETKKKQPTENFVNCPLYRDAVFGITSAGIQQYLTLPTSAPLGWVFSGEFWQLFRRVDGLVLPLTDIYRVNKDNLPKLIAQLQYYLEHPQRALIISLWNRKGGVGKTTNVINISAVLAKMGKRVLVVDFDGQSDLTRGLGLEPSDYKYQILECFDQIGLGKTQEAIDLLEKLIVERNFPLPSSQDKYSISVLPTDRDTIEKFRSDEYEIKNKQTLLKRLLAAIAPKYDYIFIDTSPDPDIATVSSLFACDAMLIPADFDQRALHHAKDINQGLVQKIRSLRTTDINKTPIADINPRVLGVVFSNHTDMGSKLEKAVEEFLAKASLKVYKTKLGVFAAVRQATFKRHPVISISTSKISRDYEELTKEIFINPNFIYE